MICCMYVWRLQCSYRCSFIVVVDSLRDEDVVYNTICVAQLYVEKHGSADDKARVAMKRVEHIYYKV